jgi:hypothetical protein
MGINLQILFQMKLLILDLFDQDYLQMLFYLYYIGKIGVSAI